MPIQTLANPNLKVRSAGVGTTLDLRGKLKGDVPTGVQAVIAIVAVGKVQRLDTRDNGIKKKSAQQLASAVVASTSLEVFSEVPLKKLRADRLEELTLKERSLGPTEGNVIAALLKGSKVLASIDVSYNSIGKEQALSLVSIFKEKDQMQSVGLASCDLGMDGAKAVADYVSGSAVLTVLNLSGNGLGATGAKAIADALASGSSVLAVLNLSQNRLGAT